jgi:hypothetical protein
MGFLFYIMENKINQLEKEMEQIKLAINLITDKMSEFSNRIKDIASKIDDIHSKPEPAINQLVLPSQLQKPKKEVAQSNQEKWLEEEGILSNYFYIRNDFPSPNVFYIDRYGKENKVKEYNGYVYLGGDRENNIPGKRFDLNNLWVKYFGK